MPESAYHIALVSNTSWSIYNFRLGLIRALIQAGHHVYAIAPRDEYSDKLTAIGATYVPIKIDNYSSSPFSDLKTLYILFKLYRFYRFNQVIHYTIKVNIYGSIAAKLAGLKSIAVVTGLGRTFQFKGITQRIVHLLYKIANRCSDEVWFLNGEDQQRFISEGLIKSKRTFILPSEGVNTSRYRGTPLTEVDNKIKRLLFAGRLLKDKGILEFVHAAKVISKTHKQVKFEIVGFVNPKNPMSVTLDEIEGWQRSGWINYLGSHEDIRPFINRADCLIFPSYYQEGISRILLEAASMSRPIITTDQVGCREVVDHNQSGFLIPPRSVIALIEKIKHILTLSRSELAEMGRKGRSRVKTLYDERLIIDIYFEKLFNLESKVSLASERKRQKKKH